MATDSPTPKSNGGESSKSKRRRSFRSKRRARKPSDTTATVKSDNRGVGAAPASAAPASAAPPKADAPKDQRERRRRRRNKQRSQTESRPTPVFEDNVSDLPPLTPAFVYTHVIRPDVSSSYEFRSEHFSKVTRRLEDFNIDLAPLWRAQEEAAKPFKFELSPELAAEWADEEEWQAEAEDSTEQAEADVVGKDDAVVPRTTDEHEAALREARRRRRARRAKAKANRRERPDASAPIS